MSGRWLRPDAPLDEGTVKAWITGTKRILNKTPSSPKILALLSKHKSDGALSYAQFNDLLVREGMAGMGGLSDREGDETLSRGEACQYLYELI